MKKIMYTVTYDVFTAESCEYGDLSIAEDSGVIIYPTDNNTLTECVDTLYHTRTNAVDGDSNTCAWFCNSTLVVTVDNAAECETDARETRYLQVEGITKSSATRLCKLLNIKMC